MPPPDMRPRWGAFLLAMLALGACGKDKPEATAPAEQGTSAKMKAETPGEVVATYQGRQLTADQVRQEMERLPAPSRAYVTAPERKRQFVENLILNDLLFDEGKKAAYDRDPEIERQVTDLRKRLVVQRVMRQYQTPPEITDEQAHAYYDENPNLYSNTQIHASHILVKDEDTAKQIKATLRNKALQDQMQGHFESLKRDAGLKLDEAALAHITPPAGSGPPVAVGGH